MTSCRVNLVDRNSLQIRNLLIFVIMAARNEKKNLSYVFTQTSSENYSWFFNHNEPIEKFSTPIYSEVHVKMIKRSATLNTNRISRKNIG